MRRCAYILAAVLLLAGCTLAPAQGDLMRLWWASEPAAASSGFDPLTLPNLAAWVYYSELGEGAITQWTNHAPSGITFIQTAANTCATNRPGEGLWFEGGGGGVGDWYTNNPPIPCQSNMWVAFCFSRTNTGGSINGISLGNTADATPYGHMLYGPDNKPYVSLAGTLNSPAAFTNLMTNVVMISWRTNQTQYLEINGVIVTTNATGTADPRNYYLTTLGRRGARFHAGPMKGLLCGTNTVLTDEQRTNIRTYLQGL